MKVLDRTDVAAAAGPGSARDQLARFLEALHPGRMGPRFTAALGSAPAPCHVLDAKYEPGVRAMLLYRRGADLLTGELLLDPDSFGLVVPPGVRLWPFPEDPGMPTLPRVADRDVLGRALGEAVGGSSYRRLGHTPRCRTRLLRYRPGKRATLLAALAGDPGRYVVKAYHDADKATAVAWEAPRLRAAAARSSALAFAPVVAHVPALRMVVQQAVRGTPLAALLCAGPEPAATGVAGAARALAEFHDLPAATARQRPVDSELRRFRTRSIAVAGVDARAGEVLTGLAERLLRLYDELPTVRLGPVHGDCSPGQFLLADRPFLMDLDHVGLSDQAVDVGTFLASLRQLEIRRLLGRSSTPAQAPAALSETFLAAYREVRGTSPEPARVRWHEAAALERKALRAFARAPRSPLPLALAAAGNRRLDALEREETLW